MSSSTPSPSLPKILLIDNEGSERVVGIQQKLKNRATVSALHPLDVQPEDLSGVDLVSVDEFLGDEWDSFLDSDARQLPVSVRNRDGLAVAAAIRSQVRGGASSRPFAITLHTGELDKLAGALPRANRESLVAAQHDLEWVFQFDSPNLAERLLELATAAQTLSVGANAVSRDFGAHWLKMPDRPWTNTAMAQIEDARPPAHSLADDTAGRSYLRWLAHKVLPYPSFLLSRDHAANLLGITTDSFGKMEGLADRYDGPLSELLGHRWWRASVQQLLANEDLDAWDPAGARALAAGKQSGIEMEALTCDQAVVSYTVEGYVDSIDTDPTNSVRLQQDGWPVWADDPWATVDNVLADGDLARTVSRADLSRLGRHS